MTVRLGTRLGVDVGSVRIGVATCDSAGMVATPVETVRRGAGDMYRIAELAADRDAIEVVVGLPRTLGGEEGIAADKVRTFAVELARTLAPTTVRLVDERLSTAVATRGMRASGVSSRAGRATVDQAAAMVILQDALDAERSAGRPPGETLTRGDT